MDFAYICFNFKWGEYQNQKGEKEFVRIFMDQRMNDVMIDQNFHHFFIDGTFDCIPCQVILTNFSKYLVSKHV